MKDDQGSRGVAAVDRALAILAALEAEAEPRTLSELARLTGLYKSTTLRLVESLQDSGFVVRLPDTRYALGPTVMRLGAAYERANPLRHHVLPALRRLVEAGTESSSFHVRQSATERLCLFRLDSRHSTLDRVKAGDRLPVDRGAAGKVLLAFDGAEGAEFDRIRAEGVALSLGERDASCAGLAAPIFSQRARLVGALSLSGPRERFGSDEVAWMRERLVAECRSLSRELGFDDVAAH